MSLVLNRFDIAYGNIAEEVAKLSYCKRHKVGCVLVCDRRIIATGYNGTEPGVDNICEDEHGETLPGVVHAEINALRMAKSYGISVVACSAYVTHAPCINCAKELVKAGIKYVYYTNLTSTGSKGLMYLTANGVTVVHNWRH